jgi:LuxR family maltose regulon positive regulatory protein
MTHAIDSVLFAERALPPRVLPVVPPWVVARARVCDLLDLGVSGRLTVVTAPTGWGKTQAVAEWATTAELPGGLIWLNVAGSGADPDFFWTLVRDALTEAGERQVIPIPDVGSHERRRLHALTVLGAFLRRSGPWVLVLDDFPSGQVGQLGRDLEVVLDHAIRGLRLVLLNRGEPAIEIQRHHLAGQLTRVAGSELAMDVSEVAEMLARHQVDASDLTARVVQRHSHGWPCGVRLAAMALKDASTTEEAMELADRSTVDYLASEVLAKAPRRVRDLIVRTSMVDEVSAELARAVLGTTDVALDPVEASAAFVELLGDGSFRCHPLLRTAARAQLDREPAGTAGEARRRAADWYLGRGDSQAALAIATAAQDWELVAHTLVESYAVPAILAGLRNEAVEWALAVSPIRAAEALIQAAVCLRRGDIEEAEALLARTNATVSPGPASDAHQTTAAFVGVAAARLRGDATAGLQLVAEARDLVAHVPDRRDELSTLLDAHEGALELCRGRIHQAAEAFKHGATRAQRGRDSAAGLECLGQLALLEAFQGDLRIAERHAAPVLKNAGLKNAAAPGLAHAHLATAWVHLDRAEPTPARQHLDRVVDATESPADPWFTLVQLLAEARLLRLTNQAEAALRLLLPAMRAERSVGYSEWLVDQLGLACAETLLAAGEPRRALGLVTALSPVVGLEAGVLAASSHFDLGEEADARAALSSVGGDLSSVPLGVQVDCWMLEARLAGEAGRPDRARVLVDRALRTAGAETLRRPFDPRATWLAALVEDDAMLRRAHGGFLAGIRPPVFRPASRQDPGHNAVLVVETLTVREAQVLGLLTEMCSTEEIATELFLSVNTVKTYVRGILRKLGVNRRVDAVRRGRELGLC